MPSFTPEQQAFVELWRPEVTATGELMHLVGACERWMNKADVDRLLQDFAAPQSPDDDVWQRGSQRAYTDLYSKGRTEPLAARLDARQCQNLLDDATASVLEKRAAREAAQAKK